jgi:hypothetical protein
VSGPFEHVLQAKMSIHYNVAAALRYGNFDERNYVPQQNADVLTIATRTRLEVDDELTKAFPAKQGAEVIVHTRAGDELRERVEDVVPTDEAGVRERFAAAATAVLGSSAAERLGELVDGLDLVIDAADLSRATRLGAAASAPRAKSARAKPALSQSARSGKAPLRRAAKGTPAKNKTKRARRAARRR